MFVCYVAAVHPTRPGQGELARLLAEIQQRTGLSYQGLADVAGVNRSQVWRWVNAGSTPGYEPLRQLTAHILAAHPDVADLASALLPAAGYETPPVGTEPAAELPPEPPGDTAVDEVSSAVIRAATPRTERLIWVNLRSNLAAAPAGAELFRDPAQSRAWPPGSAPVTLTPEAIEALDATLAETIRAGNAGLLASHPIDDAAFRLVDYEWPQRIRMAAASRIITGRPADDAPRPTVAVRRAG
jgi:transcriptional regulator with XRE-family HTH domain